VTEKIKISIWMLWRRWMCVCVCKQEAGDSNQFCWRNLFSCINLLRILNKITKWKHSRTMVKERKDTFQWLLEISIPPSQNVN